MLVAMFKTRNMELVEENNRMRTELESTKQSLLMLQNGSSDPKEMAKILREMTSLSMEAHGGSGGKQQEGVQITLYQEGDDKELLPGAAASAAGASAANVKNKCAEFAMELESFPQLPGTITVETAGTVEGGGKAADAGKQALPDSIVPCIYST